MQTAAQQIKTTLTAEEISNIDRIIRLKVKEISKDKIKKGDTFLDYPIIQNAVCRFWVRYIPGAKKAYIKYQGEKIFETSGQPIEIYCALSDFIDQCELIPIA